FELVHQTVGLAEYHDTNPMNATLARQFVPGGTLDGLGYYFELYGWLMGDVSFLEAPGLETPPRVKAFQVAKEPRWGLMVAAKYEHVGFDVRGLAPRAGAMGATAPDPAEGA